MQVGELAHHLFVGEMLQLGPGENAGAEAEFVGDRTGGDGMVARDHADVDAGAERHVDGVLRLGAERVDDADQRDEDEVVHGRHRIVDRRRHRLIVEIASGEREHAQPLLGQLLVGVQDLLADLVDRDLPAVPEGMAAQPHDHVGRALHGHEVPLREDPAGEPVRTVVEGRHELVLGVERHLGAPLERIPRLLRVGAHLRGEDDQGGLGRVADDRLVIGHRGVAAQREPQRQAPEIGKLRAGDPEDRAGLAVAAALHLEPISAGQHRGRGHLVQRQRPGLVAVDHGRPAERLDVGERFHHRLRLGQPLSARGQHRLHECRQTHRDRGNRGRDAQEHHGVE